MILYKSYDGNYKYCIGVDEKDYEEYRIYNFDSMECFKSKSTDITERLKLEQSDVDFNKAYSIKLTFFKEISQPLKNPVVSELIDLLNRNNFFTDINEFESEILFKTYHKNLITLIEDTTFQKINRKLLDLEISNWIVSSNNLTEKNFYLLSKLQDQIYKLEQSKTLHFYCESCLIKKEEFNEIDFDNHLSDVGVCFECKKMDDVTNPVLNNFFLHHSINKEDYSPKDYFAFRDYACLKIERG